MPNLEKEIEIRTPQGDLRISSLADIIQVRGFKDVVDMGAGEGRLVELLLGNGNITSLSACEPDPLRINQMRSRFRAHEEQGLLEIIHCSLFNAGPKLNNRECMVLCEVIEHIELDQIDFVAHVLLGRHRPKTLLVSTPNFECNIAYALQILRELPNRHEMSSSELKAFVYQMVQKLEDLRHPDHKFEMTRPEFRKFICKHADYYGYEAEFLGIGEEYPDFGHPTQLAILTLINK